MMYQNSKHHDLNSTKKFLIYLDKLINAHLLPVNLKHQWQNVFMLLDVLQMNFVNLSNVVVPHQYPIPIPIP